MALRARATRSRRGLSRGQPRGQAASGCSPTFAPTPSPSSVSLDEYDLEPGRTSAVGGAAGAPADECGRDGGEPATGTGSQAYPAARLGAELRGQRLSRGLSLAALGRLVHVSGDLVGKIEKADRRPQLDLLTRLDVVLEADGRHCKLGAERHDTSATTCSKRDSPAKGHADLNAGRPPRTRSRPARGPPCAPVQPSPRPPRSGVRPPWLHHLISGCCPLRDHPAPSFSIGGDDRPMTAEEVDDGASRVTGEFANRVVRGAVDGVPVQFIDPEKQVHAPRSESCVL